MLVLWPVLAILRLIQPSTPRHDGGDEHHSQPFQFTSLSIFQRATSDSSMSLLVLLNSALSFRLYGADVEKHHGFNKRPPRGCHQQSPRVGEEDLRVEQYV